QREGLDVALLKAAQYSEVEPGRPTVAQVGSDARFGGVGGVGACASQVDLGARRARTAHVEVGEDLSGSVLEQRALGLRLVQLEARPGILGMRDDAEPRYRAEILQEARHALALDREPRGAV